MRSRPADDRADRDGDREIERAELGKRAPFPQAQADNGYCEQQDSLDRDPSQTARATDQLRRPHHPAAHPAPSASPLPRQPLWHSSRAPSFLPTSGRSRGSEGKLPPVEAREIREVEDSGHVLLSLRGDRDQQSDRHQKGGGSPEWPAGRQSPTCRRPRRLGLPALRWLPGALVQPDSGRERAGLTTLAEAFRRRIGLEVPEVPRRPLSRRS
jgi:hypothetical protein